MTNISQNSAVSQENTTPQSHTTYKAKGKTLMVVLGAVIALSACQTNLLGQTASREGIDFRVKRNTEIMAAREWRDCRDAAMVLDTQARTSASAAKYAASARGLQKCDAGLQDITVIDEQDRMQANALAIQNHLKSGDVAAARSALDSFKSAFAGQDLYYPDGSSFVSTVEVLVSLKPKHTVGKFSVANVNDAVKSEVRRMNYWKHM
jgi:hypothetical protein